MTADGCADLHLHTNRSDGSYEPAELVRLAHKLRLDAIAVTDHDTVAAVEEAVAEGERLGLRVIPGVELSTLYGDADTHIVGLFVDHTNAELLELIGRAAEERRRRLVRITELLSENGIDVSAEEILDEAAGGTVGRVHLAEALMKQGTTNSISEGFLRYLGKDRPAFVEKWSPAPEECCRVIHRANGVAVLAHPGDFIDEAKVKGLIDAGCRALEAYYPGYSRAVTETYLRLAGELGVGVSGGSDCHGRRKKKRFLGTVRVPLEHLDDLERRCG